MPRARTGSAAPNARGAAADPTTRGGVAGAGGLADVDDHDGDVVGGAAVERRLHQPVGHLLGAGVGREQLVQLVERHDAGQAVGAQHPPVAVAGVEHHRVDLGGALDVAEHAHQHRAPRVHHRLLGGDAAGVDESLHERVVGGDLAQLAGAQQVDARVADVRDHDAVAVEQHGADRGAHAGELGVLGHGLGELAVGGDQGALEGGRGIRRGRVVAVGLGDAAGRDGARHVTAGVAAHAVGDEEQVAPGVPGVLVVRADPPDVRDRRARLDRGHRPTAAARTSSLRP